MVPDDRGGRGSCGVAPAALTSAQAGATQFAAVLVEAAAKTRRSRHLTNFFTLLMRVLIIPAGAVIRAAQGAVRDVAACRAAHGGAGDRRERQHGLPDGEKTCFMQATDWALHRRSLDSGDAVALLALGLPETAGDLSGHFDHEAAARALADVKPGFGTASLAEVLNDLLASAAGQRVRGRDSRLQRLSENELRFTALPPR